MKKTSLSKKFVAVFAFVLVGIFALVLVAVQIVANVTTQQFVNANVLSGQDAMGESIRKLLEEAINGYTRMMNSEHLSDFAVALRSGGGEEKFAAVVEDAAIDERYVNVAVRVDDRWFAYSPAFDLPPDSFADRITQGDELLLADTHLLKDGYLLVGRRLQNSANNLSGAIAFYLNCTELDDILATTDSTLGYTFIADGGYTVIGRSDDLHVGETIMEKRLFSLQEGVERRNINGELCIIATHAVNQYELGWSIVSVLYYNVLQHDLIVLSWVLLGIALAMLAFAIVFAVALARRTAKPVNELSQYITEVDVGSSLPRSYLIGNGDELQLLKDTYDQMILRLKDLIEQNNINMDVQRKLEIDQLQMQINPHFLYNTLDAIAWMAKIKKQPEIEKLVIDLARFFRLSLHKGDKFVSVSDEVELIYYFMEIQKARFPNSLALVCDVDPNLNNCVTLKLILQPIVENSIKHGFLGKEGVGTVTVKVCEENGDILFYVSDDGVGFDVPDDLWSQNSDGLGGYGLRNVNERIRLEYGEGYGLSVASKKGEGTCVIVRIQKRNV